jgi:MprA protease rhombosortase-interaction domain-containing protein
MTFPRISLARMMILVAVLAVNFAVVHALRDHMEEELLFLALPTVNLLAAVGLAGFCRRRMRAFALGFVVAGASSLAGFLAWIDANPWTFLHYAEPLCEAIDSQAARLLPAAHTAVVYAALAVILMIPHSVLGVVGGGVAAKAWALRRHSLPMRK